MKRLWILLLTWLCSMPLSADWNTAMTAYDKQDYAVAKTEFERLVPFGNEEAIFNLGAMYHLGEGVPQDSILGLAHFMLAAELGKPNISHVVTGLQQNLTASQLALVDTQLQRIRQQVKVPMLTSIDDNDKTKAPQAVKRVQAKYPAAAAAKGQFGYVAMRFLVDGKGNVQTINVVDSFPNNVFDREAIRAVSRWKYEASGKSHIFSAELNFFLEGGVNVAKVDDLIQQHQLWQGALIGSPQHQFMLGHLLRLVNIQNSNYISIDRDMPITAELDLSVFKPMNKLEVDFSGFVGYAVVRIADDGTIVEQIYADIDPSSQVQNLLGLKLKGKIDHDVYQIMKYSHVSAHRAPWVSASFKMPQSYSARFWWDKAAKNGSKEAQRIMAAYDKRWERYLLEQEDAEAMAWVGSRLLLEGQRAKGLALLDAAIAKQYQPAKELKKQLL